MIHRRRIAWLVLAVACLLPTGAAGEWRIWPDYVGDDHLELDQDQGEGFDAVLVFERGDAGVGQTFRPRRPLLHRLDVRVRNRGDERPARIRIWRWHGSRGKTEEAPPLFDDVIGMAGVRHTWHTRSTFPDLRVEPGALYYFRLDADGRTGFELRAHRSGRDLYPAGRLITKSDRGTSQGDLWFRTWSAAADGDDPSALPEPPHPTGDAFIRWSPPRPGGGPVETVDYLRRLERHAAWLAKSDAVRCGAEEDRDALVEADLYRISCEGAACDEDRAQRAVDRLRRFLQWQTCRFPSSDAGRCARRCTAAPVGHFESLDPSIDAYGILRHSPSWDPDLETPLRAFWRDRVETLWPRRQLGTGSRAMIGASVLLRLARLLPDDEDAKRWDAYARAVWGDFVEHLEYQGASAHYVARVWWPAVLRLAEATGDAESLWKRDGFRRLVDRYFDEVAQLGVLPGYGDATGWATDSPGLVWLFEEAARRTGDGRYRWLAHRIFAYSRDRARHDPTKPGPDVWATKMHHLADAHRVARQWSGAPRTPSRLAEVPVLSATGPPTEWWRADGDHPVGQTFRHPGGSVAGIDVRLESAGPIDARIRLWAWKGDVDRTREHAPVHSARLVSRGEGVWSATAVLPDTEPATYYLEVHGNGGPVRVGGFANDADPGGRAYGVPNAAKADLWLRTRALGGQGSVVTTRLESHDRPASPRSHPVHEQRFGTRRIPDKLVLRSGPDTDDLFALVNLLSGHRHGRPSLGSFSAVIDGGAVILSETSFPYWQFTRRAEEGNVALVRRYRGGEPRAPGRNVEIVRFVDTPSLTVAWMRFPDMEGWGVEQERRIYFVKNRFILVRDGFAVPAGMLVAVGTVWHPDVLVPPDVRGNGHRIAYPHPLDNVWPYANPARQGRLWMLDREGTVEAWSTVADEKSSARCRIEIEGPGPIPAHCRVSPAHALHRSWTGESAVPRRVWIDTLLVPEAPGESSRLSRLPAEDPAIAVDLEIRGERWIVIENPDRRAIDTGELSTDALYAIVRPGPGEPTRLHVAEATRFEGLGVALSSGSPSSTERGESDARSRTPSTTPRAAQRP